MQNNHQSLIDDLNKYTVAIKDTETGETHGTGVIITDDGLILTCYHVIGDNKNERFYYKDTIGIYFPEAGVTISAYIEENYCNSRLDIAFLRLQKEGQLPTQTTVALLSESVLYGHKFVSIGFRKAQQFEKLSTDGVIRIKTGLVSEENEEEDMESHSPPLIQLYSNEIEEGMSGAAVLDTETMKVIGIISLHYPTRDITVDPRLNFAIPIESTIKIYPAIKEKNLGLIKIRQFMDQIGFSGIYYRFDDLYVPPIEYENIEHTLQTSHCVFITGTKEYGKTWTAIKLLWEYYKKRYSVNYISEAKGEASRVVKKLSDRDDNLTHCIIYLEDPVGKIEYIPNEEFRRYITSALVNLKRQDVYLIITMREEIYNEFHPVGNIDSSIYVEKLNVGKRSYDYERRREMVLRWSAVENCRWRHDENLREIALKSLSNEMILPTPLNVKDFAMATDETRYIKNEQELLDIIAAKSRETIESFSDEIKLMKDYKILFLCLPFISDTFRIDFVEVTYQKLAKQLYADKTINEIVVDFTQVISSFIDNKISIVSDRYFGKTIRFVHPSYYEAFQNAIIENGILTKTGRIFSSVLLKVADNKEIAEAAAHALVEKVGSNFHKLPNKVMNLYYKKVQFIEFLMKIGMSGSLRFERFKDVYVPPIEYEEIEKALRKDRCVFIVGTPAYGKTWTAINLLWEFYKNNNYTPMYIEGSIATDDIITKLVNQDKSSENSVIYIEDPVGKTEYISNKRFEKSIDSMISGLGHLNAYLVVTSREEIYQESELITDIALKEYVKKLNIDNRSYTYEKRKEMLVKWARVMQCKWLENENLRNIVLESLMNEVNLPTPLNIADFAIATSRRSLAREELLKTINIHSQYIAQSFARDIKYMGYSQIDNILFLCFPFISDRFSYNFVRTEYNKLLRDFGIKDNYTFERACRKFQDKIEINDYIRFSHPSYSEALPFLLVEHDMPTAINTKFFSKVLINLSSNKDAASDVAEAVAKNYDKLPENIRNGILLKLAGNKDTARYVSEAVSNNFDKLPKTVKSKLQKRIARHGNNIKQHH
jgi:hypothetical protein